MSPAGRDANAASSCNTKPKRPKQAASPQRTLEPTSTKKTRPGRRRQAASPKWKLNPGSRVLQVLSVVVTIILFAVAIFMLLRCCLRLRLRRNKQTVMAVARERVIQQDPSFAQKSDSEIIAAVVEPITRLKREAKEMDTINDLVDQKLSEGWKPFGGSLYYVVKEKLDQPGGANKCKQNGTALAAYISSKAEEDFLEKTYGQGSESVFIGLRHQNNVSGWKWRYKHKLTNSYWENGTVSCPLDCCAALHNCTESRVNKCWSQVSCTDLNHMICEMDSDLVCDFSGLKMIVHSLCNSGKLESALKRKHT